MFATGASTRHTVQHYTHIHPLTEADVTGEFTCGGCKTYGSGKSFRCNACDYDLHSYCATCPPTIRTFMHPLHDLTLLSRGPELTCQSQCTCNICDESVEGLYYRCEICDFDVHPLCTRLPRHVRHVSHQEHPLELSRWGESTCVMCHDTCRSWRYRCGACRYDVHMDCVSVLTVTQQRGFGPHPYGPYPYYNNHQAGYNYHHHPCGNNCGPTNPGGAGSGSDSGHGSGSGRGRRMFRIIWALTIGVVCNVVASPVGDVLNNVF
ncbi:PREDICTED: diacylglycerol kinase theta-like [Tarenaya hassleriana]|uniref:diacylglycerol kinase theta-like n=1 Tax=Tarenaya hassleriana TaxID=28532 RepID=UPI0008FD3595|nr:PREDICTED: diacylglycerol kinase theta-like [Tarenaya hassleriana]